MLRVEVIYLIRAHVVDAVDAGGERADAVAHLVGRLGTFSLLSLATKSAHPKTNNKKIKEEAYPCKAGAISGRITNFKQSILETFDIYG